MVLLEEQESFILEKEQVNLQELERKEDSQRINSFLTHKILEGFGPLFFALND